ncbi:MAG: oligoendopeptidase F [Anaerolineae bacterium]|nr:oligoendopeptidase F [Anaerolineae bacterium]
MSTTSLPTRAELDPGRTWDTDSIFATSAEWEAEMVAVAADMPAAGTYENRLAEGPDIVLACFDTYYGLQQRISKLLVYTGLNSSVDATNQDVQAQLERAQSLFARFRALTAYIRPELMSFGFDTLRQWMASDPRLQPYRHLFDQLERQQAHVRSAEVESLLAAASNPFSATDAVFSALNAADLTFEPAHDSSGNEHTVAQSTIDKLRTSADRELRRTTYENYNAGYLAFKNTYAANLAGKIKQDAFLAKARGYNSSLEASLAPQHIPTTVFFNLLDVFKRNLPTWHRYWRIRRAALGYDTLHEYDIKAPLSAEPPQIRYEEAVDLICEGMAPLGDAYVTPLRQGALNQRWVDVYPNRGKRQGAFSWGTQGTHPFIMMSYSDTVFSLSTLAHELGHSMHSYFTWKTQPPQYNRYGLFVAEVASNFNQALVRDYLMRTHDDTDFQIALIEEAMSNYHRYFFIMPTLARWELAMHERAEQGQSLTANVMMEEMADLFAEGYGSDLTYEREQVGITWAQFGHMYSNFYVYQYATGIAGAHALAHGVLAGEPGAAGRYLDFLKAGSSGYPLDVLRTAGVDLTAPEPVEQAFTVLSDLVDKLEQLVSA